MNQPKSNGDKNPSQRIDDYIVELADWRGKMLAKVRKLVHETAPISIEEWKWDTPVWSQNGKLLAFGVFKNHVKINFFKGASLEDPTGLFNAGLEAKTTRAIDIKEGDDIDESALKNLIHAAVAQNLSGGKKK